MTWAVFEVSGRFPEVLKQLWADTAWLPVEPEPTG